MGLDMYLYAEQYVSGYAFRPDEEKEKYAKVINALDASSMVTHDSPSATISLTVGYWRKANYIHNWFVNNVQGGVDNCDRYWVDKDKLKELSTLLLDLLKHRGDEEYANTHLPTAEGFFFGGTEYDQYYWETIDETYKMIVTLLNKVGENNWELYYQSSW